MINNKNNYDLILQEKGFPQEAIALLCEEQKEKICSENCFFNSTTVLDYDKNGNVISQYNISPGHTENNIIPFGQIQDSHLRLSITTTVHSDFKRLLVSFNYEWKTLPLNRFQDPMGISWDRNYFSLKDNTFTKTDKYKYRYLNKPETTYVDKHSVSKNFANGSLDGITWYADLKGYSLGIDILSLYGYGFFELFFKKAGTTDLYGLYVHQKVNLSISMGIAGFGNFSVSGGSNYDSMAIKTSVKTYNP